MMRNIAVYAFIIALLLPVPAVSGEFSLQDIKTTKHNRYIDIYDYVLPHLITLSLVDMRSGNRDLAVEKVVRFINFYSTPSMFQQYEGLGSDSVGGTQPEPDARLWKYVLLRAGLPGRHGLATHIYKIGLSGCA